MGKPDIVLLVGNGIVFDFLSENSLSFSEWDPQRPTVWANQPTLADGRKVLPLLPRFAAFLAAERGRDSTITDFQIFDRLITRTRPSDPRQFHGTLEYIHRYKEYFEDELIETEARHYLALALSHFHERVVSKTDFSKWRWATWMQLHGFRIRAATSFNYDLLLETTFRRSGYGVRRSGLMADEDEEHPQVTISKPHGSIDFALTGFHFPPVEYPMTNSLSLIDTALSKLTNLTDARLHSEIILPAEASKIRDFQWVKQGRKEWSMAAHGARHLVILGLSYWLCDRPELDELIERVSPETFVHMANPKPCEEWLEILRRRFGKHRVYTWKSGPQFIP